jgi:hypothetical protein
VLGAFFYSFAAPVGAAGILGVALSIGATVMALSFAIGHISGGHFNPAVTLGLVAGGRVSGNSAAGYIIAKDRRHPEYPPLASSAAASPAGCSRSSAPEGAALRASRAAARQLGRLAPRFGARLGPIPCAAPEVRVSGTCNLRQTMPSTRHSGRRGIVT